MRGKKEIKTEHQEIIKEIMAGMNCPKKFNCVASGFKNLCKSRVWGAEAKR
jgi:hypothetical protein